MPSRPVRLLLLAALLATACHGSSAPRGPSIPAGLAATGSLGHIQLGWSPSSGGGFEGYNVYRSTDGLAWTLLTPAPIHDTTYDDPISSPAGDGVVFQYRVTALGDLESEPSAVVRSAHGTRLPARSPAGITTTVAASPYVAEGTVVVEGGDLVVSHGTKLYVLDGATVDLEAWSPATRPVSYLWVSGLLRVLARPEAHARFTAHRPGGTLEDGEGFAFRFDGAANYDPATGNGTLLQNAEITNLAWGNANGGFFITASSPRFYNLHVQSNSATGGSYLELFTGAGAIIENCSFTRLTAIVSSDLRGTAFSMRANRFRGGYYAIWFASLASPGVEAGQIEGNDFDGSREAYLFSVQAASAVPVHDNFWSAGAGAPPLPRVLSTYSTASFDFTGALAGPPAVGPSWQP